jgi:chromosome partitioning protein
MRICVGNLKGGAGKTTTSVRLALGFCRSGPTLLVDCDPEQSQSFEWSERAGESWPHDRLTVIPVATRDLYKRVRPMLDNYAHVLFDTGAKNPELLRQAMSLSEDLIITAQCTDGDLLEVAKVYQMAAEVDMTHSLRAVVLLTKVRGGTNEEAEAREFLAELGLPVLKTVVPLRRDLGRMRDAPADLGEYEDVLTELVT